MTSTSAVNITVEEASPVTRKLNVEVPADRVSSAMDHVVAEVRRHARIPGFRAGKAPRQVVERNYKGDIQRALLDRLVQETLGEAVEKYGDQVLNVRDIQPQEIRNAEPFLYAAIVEVPPAVELKNYKKLKVQKPTRKATDKDVDDVIDNLRERNAEFRDAAADEAVASGDRVQLSYDAYDGDTPVPDGHVEDHTAQLGAGGLHPKFETELEGAKVGDQLAFDIAFGDEDAPNDDLKNKTITFKVDISKIEKQELPALDDEFAAKMIPDSTVEQMRTRIEEDLNTGYEREAEEAVQTQIVDQLLELHEFEVPAGSVERRRESMAQEVAGRLMGQGYPENAVKDMLPMIFADSAPRAEREVKLAFLLKSIAEAENIEVDDAAVDAEIRAYAEAQGQSLEALKAQAQEDGRYENIRGELRNRKALETVADAANVKEVTPEAYQKHLEKQAQKEAKE